MKIHHLNCGTFCPIGGRWVHPEGKLVCHCLLVESRSGLVLVDTGLGERDVTERHRRIGRLFAALVRPRFEAAETARAQIEQLGFKATDVRHIVVTHLDLDHAGGLADFPDAEVHLLEREYDAAMVRTTLNERSRYRTAQWSHDPKWVRHAVAGERWFDFESVQAIAGLGDEILLVPLHGHTRGHAGVAVRGDGASWWLHAGDAYFFHDEVTTIPYCPAMLRLFQHQLAIDNGARLANQARLRKLAAEQGEVQIFCAHDPIELRQAQGAAPATATG